MAAAMGDVMEIDDFLCAFELSQLSFIVRTNVNLSVRARLKGIAHSDDTPHL